MLAPISHVRLPDYQATQARRPCTGTAAHGLLVPGLHAYLARARPCVVHGVDVGRVLGDWPATAITAGPSTVRVVVDTSDRAQWLAVAVHYRAKPGATLACRLDNLAGVAVDAGFQWGSATAGPLPDTQSYQVIGVLPSPVWGEALLWTGDTPPAVASTFWVRPLAVGASAGQTLQVVLVPSGGASACQVLAVSVWEIADLEVTP
jgi:hypothetical protein